MKARQVTKLKAALQDEEPVSEALLRERLGRAPDPMELEEADSLVNEAQTAGAIRWVAFRGWAWGGRPR